METTPRVIKTIIYSLVILSMVTACDMNKEVASVKTNLGQFQYMGLDPQLSFSVPTAEFVHQTGDYDSAKVRYTVNMKQNNNSFPLQTYNISVSLIVLDNSNAEKSHFTVNGKIENGVVSVSYIEVLYGFKTKNSEEAKSLKLKIKSYVWFPIYELKPYEQKEIVN